MKLYECESNAGLSTIKVFGAKIAEWMSFSEYDEAMKARAELASGRSCLRAIQNIFFNMQVLSLVQHYHKPTFGSYRGCHRGRDVVLLACGPSAKKYQRIPGALHVGVNGAVKMCDYLDFLFVTDHFLNDKSLNVCIDRYSGNDCVKFYAIIPQRRSRVLRNRQSVDRIPPIHFVHGSAKPFVIEDVYCNKFAVDLECEPLGDFGGSVFSAMQFILFTHPRRIYLVGCDCDEGYAYSSIGTFNHADKILQFRRMKEFCDQMYPDVEIVSINPVGLKGLFKDSNREYQESSESEVLVEMNEEGRK